MKKRKIILNPQKIKFTRHHKGILTSIVHKKSATTLSYGIFGLKILRSNRFHLKQLETIRKHIVRSLKKNQYLWIRILPDIPVTNKPKEVRMGKGKGAVAQWVVRLKAGHILFELSAMSPRKAFLLLNYAAKKLSVSCTIMFQKQKLVF